MQVLRVMDEYRRHNDGVMPTLVEIAERLGCHFTTVRDHVRAMSERNLVSIACGRPRNTRITALGEQALGAA